MWQTHTSYEEALHTRNQTEHGSWVLQLKDHLRASHSINANNSPKIPTCSTENI